MITFVCQAQTEICNTFLCSANDPLILLVQYVHDYVRLPGSQPLCRYNVPRALTTLHRWILEKKNCVVLCRVLMYVLYVCFSKMDNLLSVIVLLVLLRITKRISRKQRVPVPFYGGSATSQ